MKNSFDAVRSIRYASLVVMISAVSAVQACSSDTIPTAPRSVTSQPVAEFGQLRVFGTVTDENGVPVAGVIVRVYPTTPSGQPSSTVSDASGFYRVSLPSADGLAAFTEKDGYRSAWHTHFRAHATELRWDLRISRIPKKTAD